MPEYTIAVWDVTFYKVDEEGEPLLNEDGSVKLFQDKKCRLDIDWISDSVDEHLLQEIV